MKKLFLLLPVLLTTACSSTKNFNAQSDELLCKTYSQSYLTVAAMKERGFPRKKALACGLSNLTKNSDDICGRQMPDQEYLKVINYNKVKNPEMTRWVAAIVFNVYASPEKPAYEWRDDAYKRCKDIGAFEKVS